MWFEKETLDLQIWVLKCLWTFRIFSKCLSPAKKSLRVALGANMHFFLPFQLNYIIFKKDLCSLCFFMPMRTDAFPCADCSVWSLWRARSVAIPSLSGGNLPEAAVVDDRLRSILHHTKEHFLEISPPTALMLWLSWGFGRWVRWERREGRAGNPGRVPLSWGSPRGSTVCRGLDGSSVTEGFGKDFAGIFIKKRNWRTKNKRYSPFSHVSETFQERPQVHFFRFIELELTNMYT